MAPTILIVGATGNTGPGVVETLSSLAKTSSVLSGHRILALTRSPNSPVSQRLAALPGVEVVEHNWVETTAEWLREQQVVKAFIAPHLQPNQFAEESNFHVAALEAGVKYVVRISTNAPSVRPNTRVYYARAHWAVETLLSSPEFSKLQWTSLQPNAFAQLYLYSAVALVKEFRTTGKQHQLRLLAAEDGPVGAIDPYEIGVFAAHLLAQDDYGRHNGARYVLNGPEDITGRDIVTLVEQEIGAKVEDVLFKDMSLVEQLVVATAGRESRNVMMSVMHSMEPAWEGKGTASTTSKEVLEIAPPKRTMAECFKAMLED